MLTQADTTTAHEMQIAKDVAETLHKHYPGHLWAISVNEGVIVIKNLAISHTHGMVLHTETYYSDPANKTAIRMAGELLERAHLLRGRDTGENAQTLEGVAKKYQPSNGIVR